MTEKIKNTINFHKDNWKLILKSLLTNSAYAFCANSIPTFISLGYDVGVLVSQSFYYMFLVILFSRKSYETLYGKIIFWFACVLGAFSGYKFSSILINYI